MPEHYFEQRNNPRSSKLINANVSINSSQNFNDGVDILRLSTNVLRNQKEQREEEAKEGITEEDDAAGKNQDA